MNVRVLIMCCVLGPLLWGFQIDSPRAHPLQGKENAKKRKATKKEGRFDYYEKWLREDVAYIVSPEEWDVFRSLTTPDEKDTFIEQFWARRDPDPTTRENEYKIEHYRRIVYSNEHFSAGIPGWRTDRGRIYIKFGPPDRTESMPAGGHYHRRRKEGGGHTSVFPFEIWEYRNIAGAGDDIELEFVDDGGGGLYQLTYDPQRKDELIHSGFMGPTWDEIEDYETTGSRLKQYRVIGRRYAGDLPAPYRYTGGFETAKDRPFSKLILSTRLNKPPEVKFKDLQNVVNTSVYYHLIPFEADTAALRVSASQSLLTVTMDIPHESLTFRGNGEFLSGKAEIFGQITSLSHKVEGVFEETIAQDIPRGQFAKKKHSSSVFQKQFLLRPGLYKLNLVVKDVESDKMGTWEGRLEVPRLADNALGISSILIAQEISAADPAKKSSFYLGRLKVVPRVTRRFHRGEDLGFYFQIYHPTIDPMEGKPRLKVEFAIAQSGSEPSWRDCSRLVFPAGEYSTVARLTNLKPYMPGDYRLSVRVEDNLSGQHADASVPFTIEPR